MLHMGQDGSSIPTVKSANHMLTVVATHANRLPTVLRLMNSASLHAEASLSTGFCFDISFSGSTIIFSDLSYIYQQIHNPSVSLYRCAV